MARPLVSSSPAAGDLAPAVPTTQARSRDTVRYSRAWLLAALFAAAVLAMLYRDYPMGGMVVEESWNLYSWSSAIPEKDSVSWPSLLLTRKGGSYMIRRAMLAIGSTPVLVNMACIASVALSLVLFGLIVARLARRYLVPAVLAATLYPFASGAHFWQVMLYHHVAVVLFLAALLLYLDAIAPSRGIGVRVTSGVASLVLFWLSIATQEHAILMPALFMYIALYQTNDAGPVIRFARWWSPAVVLALCYVAVSASFMAVTLFHGNPRLSAATGARAWVSSPLVLYGAVAVNSVFALGASVMANSIGFLGYPLLAIGTNVQVLAREVERWAPGVLIVALLGAGTLAAALPPGGSAAKPGMGEGRFTLVLGALWAALIYVPVSTSFAYPTVVGQSADRVNMLALFGIALCIGTLVVEAARRAGENAELKVASIGFFAITVLLTNLYIQREYWIEAAAKERRIVVAVLDGLGRDAAGGRKPVLLLDREDKPLPVRARLMAALREPRWSTRALGVTGVVLGRHFGSAGEMEATSFHLHGIPLFGGATDNARWIVANYGRQLGRTPVPVYRIEQGFRIQDDAHDHVIDYEGFPETHAAYPKTEYGVVMVKLAASFFEWRGAVVYSVGRGLPSPPSGGESTS